jgi:hypothetical protein
MSFSKSLSLARKERIEEFEYLMPRHPLFGVPGLPLHFRFSFPGLGTRKEPKGEQRVSALRLNSLSSSEPILPMPLEKGGAGDVVKGKTPTLESSAYWGEKLSPNSGA